MVRKDETVTVPTLGSVEAYCLLIAERLTLDLGEVTRGSLVAFAAKECSVELSGETISTTMTRLADLGYLRKLLKADPSRPTLHGPPRKGGRPPRRFEVTTEGRAIAYDVRKKWTTLLSTTYPYPVE